MTNKQKNKHKEEKYIVRDKRGVEEVTEIKPDISLAIAPVVETPDAPDYTTINFFMCGDRILVQNFPRVTQWGRFYLPQQSEMLAIDRGRVVGVGPDVKVVKVGDIIYKIANLGQSLTSKNGEEYTFHPENAVIAIDTVMTPDFEPRKTPEKTNAAK